MNRAARWILVLAALSIADATASGALASHFLASRISPERLAVFETAVRYQFYHSVGLFAIGLLALHVNARGLYLAAILIGTGIAFFTGSLYAIVFGAPRVLGVVTPIGGALLVAGWLVLAWALYRAKVSQSSSRPPS
jgi:uncharacterized membrane protein YgdD (TMEM256/DUF423 family)